MRVTDSVQLDGTPTAPTAAIDTNTQQVATTAYVVNQGYLKASLAATLYQPLDGDLTAIAALAQTTGLLRKTSANTWQLDTNTYLTGNQPITLSGDATGSGTTSIPVTLSSTGVTAGSYGSASSVATYTVDAKGRISAANSTAIQIAQTQVTNLANDLAAKAPLASPTFTGTVTLPSTTSIGTVSSTELGYVDGVTSSIQTQLNGKAASSHTHTIANVTNLQSTLDGKAAAVHSHAIADVTGLQSALDSKAAATGSTDIEITDATKGVILKSPNGTRYRLTVADDGSLTTTAV